GQVTALQLRVVVHAHPGQQGHLFAPQPGHAPVAPSDEVGFFGSEPGPAGAQELPHLAPVIHRATVGAKTGSWGGLPVRGSAATSPPARAQRCWKHVRERNSIMTITEQALV